jgi:hypothetical protein
MTPEQPSLHELAYSGDVRLLRQQIEAGTDVNGADGQGNTALVAAALAGQAESIRVLLEAGADPTIQNNYQETAMHLAASVDVVRLLQAVGEYIGQCGSDTRRLLAGLSGDSLHATPAQYEVGKWRRFGRTNPEQTNIPFWIAMVKAGCCAYAARAQFGDTTHSTTPVWCFDRFGASFTELPDGRFVQIGGEHEDYYDPDFCIYNDVVLHTRPGEFTIFSYPENLFPPTDFHSATYVKGGILIIGSLGYSGKRTFGSTPVFRLSSRDWSIQPVQTSGENPGWISRHSARLVGEQTMTVTGGKVCGMQGANEAYEDNRETFKLDLTKMHWVKEKD